MNGTKMNLGISHLDISSGISVVMWSLVELVFYILRAISYSPQLCTEHSDLYFVPENYNAYLLFLQNFIQFRSIFVLVFHLIFNSHFIIYSYQLSVDPLSRNHWDLPCPCIQWVCVFNQLIQLRTMIDSSVDRFSVLCRSISWRILYVAAVS